MRNKNYFWAIKGRNYAVPYMFYGVNPPTIDKEGVSLGIGCKFVGSLYDNPIGESIIDDTPAVKLVIYKPKTTI